MDSLDREFGKHLVYVFNQVLQLVRKEGISAETLEKAGKLAWRLYNVYKAYRSMKEKHTPEKWLAGISVIEKALEGLVNAHP